MTERPLEESPPEARRKEIFQALVEASPSRSGKKRSPWPRKQRPTSRRKSNSGWPAT